MIRKFTKKSDIELFTFDAYLEGPIFVYGKLGCLDGDNELDIIENNIEVTKTIKDTPDNFIIKSLNFEHNIEQFKKAIKKSVGKKECIKIIFDDDSYIICSNEHHFFDRDRQIIQADKLKVGDKLFKKC